ncbi:hypothetical protein CX649_00005 [Bacillaceae bacterium ZC4]|nr:hypothetical protein CX649_00005 [Bacillaceae bacterium ZC4]
MYNPKNRYFASFFFNTGMLLFHSYGNIANRLAMGSLLLMVLLGIFFLLKVKPQAPAAPKS